MATKQALKTTFEPGKVIQPIFTGGSVAIDDGATILATTLGEDVVLTDPAGGQQLAKIEGDGELVSAMTLTPSGSHLIVCSRSLTMKTYALKRNEGEEAIQARPVKTLKPHSTPVVALAVDRTSTLLATGGTDGAIKVWDITGGYITHTFRGPVGLVSSILFFEVAGHANDRKAKKGGQKRDEANGDQYEGVSTINWRLASGFQDGKVRVWDLHRRNCIANLETHSSDVQGLAFSPEQQALSTGSRDKTMVWWDARSWKMRKMVPCLELVEAVGFLNEGRLTFSAGAKGCIRLWDTDTGREITRDLPRRNETDAIVGAVYRPELPFIICVQMDHTLALYRPPNADGTTNLAVPEPFRRVSGTHDEIIDLAYLTPNHNFMALATNAEDIRIVSVTEPESTPSQEALLSGETLYFGQDVGLLKGHDDTIITLDTDWSGHWIATGAKDNTARLWRVDPQNGIYDCYVVFTGHTESLGAVSLPKTLPPESSAARKDPLNNPPAFLITGSQDQTIKKWTIPRQPQTQQSQKGGPRVAAAYTRKAHDKDINAVDVHHLGQLFASASQDKMVKIWSVEEGEVQGILKGHRRGVWSVKFAPAQMPLLRGEEGTVAGKGIVLTGSGDKTVKLWNLADYSCIRTLEGHANSVLKVAWLNVPPPADRGKRPILIASAGGDGLVKVWDANSGETECTLDNHEDRIWTVAVHPENNTIVSGGGDSVVTFWKDVTVETQAAAAKAAFELIEQEQELENHIRTGSYRKAIILALQLNHPGRLLNLFSSVVTRSQPEKGSLCGSTAVDEVLANLTDDHIFLLLLRLRDWNANARTAPVAQKILWALANSYPAEKFSNLKAKDARGQRSLKEVVHALKVYTDRHRKRIDELYDQSYLIEYTLQGMDSLLEVDWTRTTKDVDRDEVMAL